MFQYIGKLRKMSKRKVRFFASKKIQKSYEKAEKALDKAVWCRYI